MITLKRKPEVITAIKWHFDPLAPEKNNFAEIKRFGGERIRLESFRGLIINNGHSDSVVANGHWVTKGVDGSLSDYSDILLNFCFEAVEEKESIAKPLPDQVPYCRACGARSADYCHCNLSADE